MGKITGFLEFERQLPARRPIDERLHDWRELEGKHPEETLQKQAARCMDCGIPFCHKGCPLGNIIPDWNDLIYRGRWQEAIDRLHSTNNFPDFTGRICPAPCEEACVLNINDDPVTIKQIEKQIIDHACKAGMVQPQVPPRRTGKNVAVVGSGPAGMACAQQLARAGHWVTLFERADRIGGLLRYGIPDFKMEKHLIDRRMSQMAAEGVEFRLSTEVGVTVSVQQLLADFEAVPMTGGAEWARDLEVPGREFSGIHYAMDFLPQQNKRNAGDDEPKAAPGGTITASGKHVIVIGGGDTGSDCIGTSTRQGAASITQLEILPKPPEHENKALTWPDWPLKLRTSSSQEEGVERDFAVMTQKFSGANGEVKKLHCVRIDDKMKPVPGTEFELPAELMLLAMGFVHPVHEGMVQSLGLALDPRGNVKADTVAYQSSNPKIFACGDMRRGQSLVVWAIREGRQAAHAIDKFLMGSTTLPR